MSVSTIDPSTVDWTQRSDKRVSDQFLIEEVVGCVKDRKACRALTFPAAEFLMEHELSRATPKTKWHIDAVESNPRVLRKMAITVGLLSAKRMTANIRPGRFLEVLQGFENLADEDSKQYDFIYPDWMGTWSMGKRAEVDSIFQLNLLRPGGHLAGTLALQRGHGPAIDELHRFTQGLPIEVIDARPNNREREFNYHLRTQGIPRYIVSRAASYGVRLQNPKVMVYDSLSDSGRRNSVQMKMVFQRSYV